MFISIQPTHPLSKPIAMAMVLGSLYACAVANPLVMYRNIENSQFQAAVK